MEATPQIRWVDISQIEGRTDASSNELTEVASTSCGSNKKTEASARRFTWTMRHPLQSEIHFDPNSKESSSWRSLALGLASAQIPDIFGVWG